MLSDATDQERRHLAMAKKHLASAEAHVSKQRELIQTMQARGGDTNIAQTLLDTMLVGLDLMRSHLRMIEARLAQLTAEKPTGRTSE